MATQMLERGSQFAPTRWSVVVAARQWPLDSASERAMGELANLYWFPLYTFIRRRGQSPVQAEDLVQGFFTHLLEKEALASIDQNKGKFRSFLLASLKNYLANQWDKDHTQKRAPSHPLQTFSAESRYAAQPVDHLTPERAFERRWALTILEKVLADLREYYARRQQSVLLMALEHLLVGGQGAEHGVTYAQIGTRLGLSESAVKVASHRMRKRFRELLREEIAHTVSDPALVDDEIRELLSAL